MAEFTKSLLDPSRLPKGTLAMISCSSDEQSYEDPKLGHGIFMYYVLEGLAGQADRTYRGDGNNLVSYRELEDYVYRKTSDHAWAKHERKQTPKFYAKWELPNFNLVALQSDIHVLLVGETNDRRVGISVRKDLTNITQVFYQNVPARCLNLRKLDGAGVSPKNILKAIKDDFHIDRSDTFVVYYSGHAAIRESGHFFYTSNGRLARSALEQAVRSRAPRLAVVLTDCDATPTRSSAEREDDSIVTKSQRVDIPTEAQSSEYVSALFRSLFLDSTGCVNINACSENENSFMNVEEGAFFTRALTRHLVERAQEGGSWKELVIATQERTNRFFKSAFPDGYERGGTVQRSQNIRVWSLPQD